MDFETQLKKLKYLTLKQVSTLAKENKLTKETIEKIPYNIIEGDKANYRCCIYRERAVVLQRAQLASGYVPNDNIIDDLVDMDEYNHVMYVLPAACDKCPIHQYTVTEVCRGCIQHKCMEVCPVNAITRVQGRAYINHDICVECGMCKKVCPYNAIVQVNRPCKISCPTGALEIDSKSKRAKIDKENCINCGACMVACPFGAIADKSYIVPVTQALVDKKKDVYAVVAPSIVGQLENKITIGMIKDSLKKIGFKDMIEVACGADAVTVHESKEFTERMKNDNKYMTTSCCSSFVEYIEKKFSDQISNISTTVSPMVAVGRMIKQQNNNAIIVFIGPCTSKKAEITRENVKDSVDYVLTFEEAIALLGAFNIKIEECKDLVVEDATIYGRGFAQAGGVTAAIQSYCKEKEIDIELKPVKVSGKDAIKKAMTMAKVGRLGGNFIEGMMCEGGCINGAGIIKSMIKSKGQLVKFNNSSQKKSIKDNNQMKQFKNVNMKTRKNNE